MKTFWFVTVLVLAQAFSNAADTAYQALHLIGGSNPGYLNHVIQVSGTYAQPQPASWKIMIDDQSARGGVREIDVSKGRVVSEHTPMRAYAGTGANAVMDFKHLNLDSEGAFTIANQEAAKRNVGFDSVDYLLRGDEQTGAPVWIMKLIDVNHILVGTITISADNGAVLNTAGFPAPPNGAAPPNGIAAGPPAAVVPPPPPGNVPPPGAVVPSGNVPPPAAMPPPNNVAQSGTVPPDDDNGNAGDGPGGPPYGVGHQINKGLHRLGADLQQFFTGKRTWDKKFDNEP